MQCRECAAELSPLREFCPKCGAPAHRGGPEPAGARSEEELKQNRKKVLVVAVALLLTAGIGSKIPWLGASIDFDSHDRPNGPVAVEAQQLFQAYRDDARAARKRFAHREILVTGEFVRIAPDAQGDPDLRLKTSDPQAPLGIDLIRASHAQAAQLQPGQSVTLSCERVARTGKERWLRHCAIDSVAEGKAAPAVAPGAPARPAAPAPPAAPTPPTAAGA